MMTAASIEIVEVGARDGLQNEAGVVPTDIKVALIRRLIGAGARRVEVASFVHPARVPQMADAEAVVDALGDIPGDVTLIGLVLNKRGLLRALDTRSGGRRAIDEAGAVAVATDSFGQRNQGQTVDECLAEIESMLRLAADQGLAAQVTISVAWGCPFEGRVPPERVAMIAARLAEAGAPEIALADTIGVAVPAQVTDLFGRVAQAAPGVRLRAHFHNTRGTGIANAWAAAQAGVTVLDSSLGGLGGCPFAPGATGNIATEDLVYLLETSGVETGLDLDRLIATNGWFAPLIGKALPSAVGKAGRPRA